MPSEKTASIICSLISVINIVIMIFLTALAYRHLSFRERYYLWLMFVPMAFNLLTAILFAGRCLSPVGPFYCVEKEEEELNSQNLDDFSDRLFEVVAVPGTSGYQTYRQTSNSSTLRNSSSSRSFFASGSTEVPKTFRMKQTLLSEGPGVYEFKHNPDGSSFLSAVISSKRTNKSKRGGNAKYARLNDGLPHAVPRNDADGATSDPRGQTLSEKTPLIAKKSHEPISVFEDPTVYGTVDPGIQKQYPFPMYGVVPKIPGANVELEAAVGGRSKSLEECGVPSVRAKEFETRNNSWPISDNKAPVFYFTPQKQIPKCPDEKIMEKYVDEDANPRVDLELPSSDTSYRVADWLLKSPTHKKGSADSNQQKKSSRKCLLKSEAVKGKSTTSSKAGAKSKNTFSDVEDENEQSSSATKELNKFCILGRGYFYATETTNYLPVETPKSDDDDRELTESTDSQVTLINSPKKIAKDDKAK